MPQIKPYATTDARTIAALTSVTKLLRSMADVPNCDVIVCPNAATRRLVFAGYEQDPEHYCDEHAAAFHERFNTLIVSDEPIDGPETGPEIDPDPTDPDLPPVPGGSPAPTPCEVAGCSRPATVALTDENATGAHMRYLCTPHAAVRRALAARPGARFHITGDVWIAEVAR